MEQDKKPKNKPKYLQEIAVSFFFLHMLRIHSGEGQFLQ
jgi:hypothetical protein